MLRARTLTVSLTVALTAVLVPTAAGATAPNTARASEVDFGTCVELATGSTVALSELEARVPGSVPVLSLTDQGFVFPGSDDLGILITRTLECDSISVTRNGRTRTQLDRSIAQVGTPIDTSVRPASPFSNDGGNGADFNNYVLAYYSDSSIYRNAMRRAGVRNVASARIAMHDETVDECVVDRTVTVSPRSLGHVNYGYTAAGIVPDAACEPAGVSFIGNWWSVRGGRVAVLSNRIAGQSAVFIDPSETTIAIDAGRRSQLADLFGAGSATADAFGVIGVIPETDGVDMIITPAGGVERS